MTWELFYLTCFVVGLVLCTLSVITGGGHVHAGHFHFGGHTHLHPPGHAHTSSVSAVNGFTVTAFLCWFGGAGYLLRTHSGLLAPATLVVATLSGLVGGGIIFWFLASVLLPRERALTAEDTEITGVVARVTDPLRPGAMGEILYSQLGVRCSAPARTEDGSTIDRDVEVIVLRYERGIAYVRKWDELNM